MAPFKKILSSEIARLVYGYLNDCGVDEQLSCQFLHQSPYLTECRELHDEGDAFNTDFKGLSLKEILQEYSFIHHTVDTKIKTVYSLERVNLETPRLSDKLCLLLNVPERPRSRTSSFLGSRVLGFDKLDNVRAGKENQPEAEEMEIPGNDVLDSSGSYGVPETPGNSLAFELMGGNKSEAAENPIDQETFLNNMELGREMEKLGKKPKTLSRSLSVNDLSTDKRKTKPKFFTPNNKRTDESSKEMILQILKDLSEDKEWPEKIAKTINEAREGISEVPSLDDAINTIIEKTTADPSFNQIMEQTLNNFDLCEYLKPTAKDRPKPKNNNNASTRVEDIEFLPDPLMSDLKKTASIPSLIMPVHVEDHVTTTVELRPYPEIRYDPVDCNILTGTVDAQGNCVFYTSQAKKVVAPPKRLTTRQRTILPKMPKLPNLNPVIVCTPLMPPPVVDKPKTRKTTKKSEESKEVPEVSEVPSILPSLLATPAPAEPPVEPKSLTPGRKSYIRALEFETPAKEAEKLSWDAALRAQLSELEKTEKTSPKKSKREKKVKKVAPRRKKPVSPRVTRSRKITISPSKNNLTAKRNTYAISHGSSSAFESSSSGDETQLSSLVEMTPAKEEEVRQEETPFTKLLRENVADVNIDLSMIPTPMFPATPCIETATPAHAARNTDYSSGSSYYKPELTSPGSCFNELQEDHVQDVTTPSGTNRVISPDQLKINDLVNEGKRILARSSGKNMNLLKLHTIASCDTKLGENIPIRENLKEELERKRKSTILKIKNVEKNPSRKRKVSELLDQGSARRKPRVVEVDDEVGRTSRLSEVDGQVTSGSSPRLLEVGLEVGKSSGLLEVDLGVQNRVTLRRTPRVSEVDSDVQTQVTAGRTLRSLEVHSEVAKSEVDPEVQNRGTARRKPRLLEAGSEVGKSSRLSGVDLEVQNRVTAKRKPRLKEKDTEVGRSSSLSEVDSEVLNRVTARRKPRSSEEGSEVQNQIPTRRTPHLLEVHSEVHTQMTTRQTPRLLDADSEVQNQIPSRRTPRLSEVHSEVQTQVTTRRTPRLLEVDSEVQNQIPSRRTPRLSEVHSEVPTQVTTRRTPRLLEVDSEVQNQNPSRRSPRLSDVDSKVPKLPDPSSEVGNQTPTTKKPRLSEEMCSELRHEIPPFVDDGQFPDLSLTSRKKFFFVQEILKRDEVIAHLKNYSPDAVQYINLKPCVRKIFKTLFNWLKHPHQHEVNAAGEKIHAYLADFAKINAGIRYKKKSNLSNLYKEFRKSGDYSSDDGSSIDSAVVTKNWTAKRKTDATLPLKKRKKKNVPSGSEQTEILKHIDVDRFLSRVHGQEKS